MNRIILTLAALALAAPCWGQETRSILKGATDQSVYIRIVDSADGTPETGVTSATAGLDLEYVRNRAAAADLTESDLAAVDSAHSDGGIKHVGNGVYRVDLPDAACATGVDGVLVTGTATDMVVIPARIQLTGFDLQTATVTPSTNRTYYVRTTGNDSTGDGSSATPWLTIDKAIQTIGINGGHTILVGAGTYAENTSSSGYLQANRKFVQPVIVRPEVPGASVIVKGSAGPYALRFQSGTNTEFHDVAFESMSTSDTAIVLISDNPAASHGNKLVRCSVTAQHAFGSSDYMVSLTAASGTHKAFAMIDCTVNANGNDVRGVSANFIEDFEMRGTSVTATGLCFNGGADLIDPKLTDNVFTASGSLDAVSFTAMNAANTVTFDRNRVVHSAGASTNTAVLINGGSSGQLVRVNCRDNYISSACMGLRLYRYIDGGEVIGNNSTAINLPIAIRMDSGDSTAGVANVAVKDNWCVATADLGHAFLAGVNSSNLDIEGNYFDARSADYGAVIKGARHRFVSNTVYGGDANAVYCKGAANIRIEQNAIYQTVASGDAIKVGADDTPTASSGITLQQNTIVATNGALFNWASGSGDSGGSFVGENRYQVISPATWGTIRGTSVSSLATSRAAWSGYGGENEQLADADVQQWSGTAVASPNTAGYPIVTVKDGTGTGEIDTTSGGVAIAAGTEIEVADADLRAALGMAAADLDTQLDAIVADTNELQTDWVNGGRLDLILDARSSQSSVDTIDGIVDAILLDTAEIGTAGAGLSAIPWRAAWDAEVQSEVADALAVYDPPTKAEMDSGFAAISVTLSPEDIAAIAAAVDIDEASLTSAVWAYNSRTLTAGTNIVLAKGTGVTGFNDLDAAGIRSAVGLASANIDTQFSNISVTLSAQDIEDIVDGIIEGGGGVTPVSADIVGDSYTWIGNRYRASNIVEVENGFTGALALKPDMNPGVTITTVNSVTITGAATVTATGLTVDRSRTVAQFTVPELTTEGTYTVRVEVTTVDGAEITTTATLKVY